MHDDVNAVGNGEGKSRADSDKDRWIGEEHLPHWVQKYLIEHGSPPVAIRRHVKARKQRFHPGDAGTPPPWEGKLGHVRLTVAINQGSEEKLVWDLFSDRSTVEDASWDGWTCFFDTTVKMGKECRRPSSRSTSPRSTGKSGEHNAEAPLGERCLREPPGEEPS
jgi:hypothetical protein